MADLEHVGIVPMSGPGIERTRRDAVESMEHASPFRCDVATGAPAVGDVLAPGADVGLAPGADGEDIVAIGIVAGQRRCDLAKQCAHPGAVGACEVAALDE